MLNFRRLVVVTTLAVAGLSLTACGSDSGSDSGGDVVVGFYPLEYLATSIGGDSITVRSLAQPGADPHDMELTAKQVASVGSASLVVYQKGMQPAVDDVVANEQPKHILDVATVVNEMHADDQSVGQDTDEHAHAHESLDPHTWLDPKLMKKMAEAVKDELVKVYPDNAKSFEDNYASLATDLSALDEQFSKGLAQCARTDIVTTHTAFGYLAKAYGLHQVGILGLSGEEPSPQKLADVEKYVKQNGVTTIFFEQAVSDDYAKTVAESTGAKTAVLTPLETAPETGDYLSAMQQNLQELRTALSCS